MNAVTPRLYRIVEGLYFGRIYWVMGDLPTQSRQRNEVKSPPTAGWSHCFVVDKGTKLVTLFCPYSLTAHQVSRTSYEYTGMTMDLQYTEVEAPIVLDKKGKSHGGPAAKRFMPDGFQPFNNQRHDALVKTIQDAWATAGRLGLGGRDFDVAALVLTMLGGEVPMKVVVEGAAPEKPSGGKGADALGLLKPVKRGGRRGQVLTFFLPGQRSILEAMAEFGVSRSNLLSQLYLLQKDHGIGYTLTGDAAIITLPPGCEDPFEPEVAA